MKATSLIISGLYNTTQLPCEVRTLSSYVSAVFIANAVRISISPRYCLHHSYICSSSCTLIGCGYSITLTRVYIYHNILLSYQSVRISMARFFAP